MDDDVRALERAPRRDPGDLERCQRYLRALARLGGIRDLGTALRLAIDLPA